jgi:ankyrin repeat protein
MNFNDFAFVANYFPNRNNATNSLIARYKDTFYIGSFEGTREDLENLIKTSDSKSINIFIELKKVSEVANANLKDFVGTKSDYDKALLWAVSKGHLDVVKYFHKKGIDIFANDNMPILWAAESGHLEILKYLHENGADIFAQDNYAIRWASKCGHSEVVQYLIDNGAKLLKKP